MKDSLSIYELYKITSISLFNYAVYSYIGVQSLVLEFLILLIPQYLAMLYFEYSSYIYLVGLTIILLKCMFFASPKNTNSPKQGNPIDSVRYCIISSVVIAIFCADFPIYSSKSHKLGKSMDYGLRLMDIGAGSFTMNAGFFSSKASTRKKIKKILQSFALGSIRLFSKIFMKVDVDDREFGVHLNYFFLLAILNFLSIFITTKYEIWIGLSCCITHELLLHYTSLRTMIFSASRKNIILANIEGIFFILPTLGIFLVSSGFSKIFTAKQNRRTKFWSAAALCVLLCVLSNYISPPCRRIHNLSYCMVIIVLLVSFGLFAQVGETYFNVGCGRIRFFGSQRILFILLGANILTWLYNSFLKRDWGSTFIDHCAIVGYLLLVFFVPVKLWGTAPVNVELAK